MNFSRTILVVCLLLAVSSPALAQEGPRGWMGVLLGDPGGRNIGDADLPTAEGIRVVRIVKDGPAARAGLRAGDLILRVDGHEVESVPGLISTVSDMDPGAWVSFDIDRGGDEKQVRLRLRERPARTRGLEMVEGWLGVDAIDLPQALREHFGAPGDAGVMVSGLAEGGPAHISGLELGDVVFEIDGRPVRSPRGFLERIRGGGIENVLEISLMRSGVVIVVEATVAEEPPPEP